MRIVLAGTPYFAIPTLNALLGAGHELVAVLTQPDRPAGRGRRPTSGPVKARAQTLGIEVLQPVRARDAAAAARLRALRPQALVVAAYGLILDREVLAIPELGCLNVHASLLPRWRGAAPIHRALEAGDTETGITIMQMDEGLDTGPLLASRTTAIGARDTAGTLHERLAELGAELLTETLGRIAAGRVTPLPQDESRVSYAPKITPADAVLDWRRPAIEIDRRVRAMNPWPVARTGHRGASLRVWRASVFEGAGKPGQILRTSRAGIEVACGAGALRIEALQRHGGRRLAAGAFLNGYRLEPGEVLDYRPG